MIHHSCFVDQSAKIHKTANIGPFCVIGPNVVIGEWTRVGAHTVIGGPPEHKKFWGNQTFAGVKIGSKCWISNHVTIDAGCKHQTEIGNNVSLLRSAHVGHDAIIEDDVVLSCNTIVGGHTLVMKGANMGLGSMIHQNCIVGAYALLGMGCVANKKTLIRPGNIYVGNPAQLLYKNTIGLQRAGIDDKELHDEELRFTKLL